MLKDKEGNTWVGTRNHGVDSYDGKILPDGTASVTNFSEKDSLSNNISCLFEDSKGNIWIGSRDGILLCYDGKKFINFSEQVSK